MKKYRVIASNACECCGHDHTSMKEAVQCKTELFVGGLEPGLCRMEWVNSTIYCDEGCGYEPMSPEEKMEMENCEFSMVLENALIEEERQKAIVYRETIPEESIKESYKPSQEIIDVLSSIKNGYSDKRYSGPGVVHKLMCNWDSYDFLYFLENLEAEEVRDPLCSKKIKELNGNKKQRLDFYTDFSILKKLPENEYVRTIKNFGFRGPGCFGHLGKRVFEFVDCVFLNINFYNSIFGSSRFVNCSFSGSNFFNCSIDLRFINDHRPKNDPVFIDCDFSGCYGDMKDIYHGWVDGPSHLQHVVLAFGKLFIGDEYMIDVEKGDFEDLGKEFTTFTTSHARENEFTSQYFDEYISELKKFLELAKNFARHPELGVYTN